MTTFSREYELAAPIKKYFRRKSYRQVREEMQFYEYRVDLYVASPSLGLSVAIELKLLKWERALQQALVYQLCADLVYIAMPHTSKGIIDNQKLTHFGVGLVLVYPSMCREVLPARQSSVVRPDYLAYYREVLSDGWE